MTETIFGHSVPCRICKATLWNAATKDWAFCNKCSMFTPAPEWERVPIATETVLVADW